jgi:tetratricopeptide (TPR) repeat protein
MSIDKHAGEDRPDDVIEVRIGVEVVADPHFPKGPKEGSLPRDFRGSETEELLAEGADFLRRGRPAKALQKIRRAEAMARGKYGPNSPVVAWTQNYVGAAWKEMNRFPEAEAAFREALAIREEALDAGDPSIAVSLNNLGDILHQQGRSDEGVPLLARAVDIESKAYGPDSRHTMFTRTNLVEVLEGAGRKKEAVRELKKLRTGLKRHGDNLFGFGDIPERVQDLAGRLGA